MLQVQIFIISCSCSQHSLTFTQSRANKDSEKIKEYLPKDLQLPSCPLLLLFHIISHKHFPGIMFLLCIFDE